MTNIKVSVVQKARYGVLVIPIAWLLFSIWVMVNDAFPPFKGIGVQEVSTSPSAGNIFSVVIYGCWTLWAFAKILKAVKNHSVISTELKSGFIFLLGFTLMVADTYLHISRLLSYTGIAMVDVAAIIMIVTLLQGKPFAKLELYHKDIQLERIS